MDVFQTCSYLDKLKRFRKLHNEMQILDDVMKQFDLEVGPLEDAETCLSVGTGYGEYDMMFAKQFLPNLKKFIAVEMDHNSVEELKRNLENSFGGKLQVEIHEMLIEDFHKNISANKEVDVVLACHSLYLLSVNERMKCFESCINSWLKPETGRFVVLNSIEDNDMARLCKRIRNKYMTSMDVIEAELDFFGWKPLHEIFYDTKIDVIDTHEAYESMFMYNYQVNEEVFTKHLKELAKDGALMQRCKLCVFAKVEQTWIFNFQLIRCQSRNDESCKLFKWLIW